VRAIYLEGAGCYGRNGHEDAAADAALLAKAVGRPVRVQWMRADEHGWDPKGPPTLVDLRASLDASGDVTAWQSEFFIPQAAAGADPLEFRRKYLDDKRGIELLERLAALARWEKRPSPQKQSGKVARGRGISYVKYELVRTYVGAVAEVEVDRGSGQIRVLKF